VAGVTGSGGAVGTAGTTGAGGMPCGWTGAPASLPEAVIGGVDYNTACSGVAGDVIEVSGTRDDTANTTSTTPLTISGTASYVWKSAWVTSGTLASLVGVAIQAVALKSAPQPGNCGVGVHTTTGGLTPGSYDASSDGCSVLVVNGNLGNSPAQAGSKYVLRSVTPATPSSAQTPITAIDITWVLKLESGTITEAGCAKIGM
jgi:hypothetical protein